MRRMLVWVLGMGIGGAGVNSAGRVGMVLVRRRSWRVARGVAAAMAAAMLSTARMVTVWNWRAGGMDSTRAGQISTFSRAKVRTASRRKVDFLFWDSARVMGRSG